MTTKVHQEDPLQLNPFCPLPFAFDTATKDLYKDMFGTRNYTTALKKGIAVEYVYNDAQGTYATFYASTDGETPVPCSDPVTVLKKLEMHNNIKVSGWCGGMRPLDYFLSMGQVCPKGAEDFYGKWQADTFNLKDENMCAAYLNALVGVVDSLVDGVLKNCARDQEPFVVHWDGDVLYDEDEDTFNNYGPLVWAIAANLNRRGRLAALLAVKNARSMWNKAIGSEPEGTREDVWFRTERKGCDGNPRETFATSYFRESKIADMMKFITKFGNDGSKPFYCITHSTEKNTHAWRRQDETGNGYFGASVQSAMAQGPKSCAVVVLFGGGDFIYKELTNRTWKGSAAADKFTKGYKLGTTVIALDVRMKEQSRRCKVFEQEGEPDHLFNGVSGKMLQVTDTGISNASQAAMRVSDSTTLKRQPVAFHNCIFNLTRPVQIPQSTAGNPSPCAQMDSPRPRHRAADQQTREKPGSSGNARKRRRDARYAAGNV